MKAVSSLPQALGHEEGHSFACSSSPPGHVLLIPEELRGKTKVHLVLEEWMNEARSLPPSMTIQAHRNYLLRKGKKHYVNAWDS